MCSWLIGRESQFTIYNILDWSIETMEDNRRNSIDRTLLARVRFCVEVGRDNFYIGSHLPSMSIRNFIITIQVSLLHPLGFGVERS